jgi:hypothetical protein
MPENNPVDGIYFNLKELGIILVLSILAAVSGALVPSYLFPEERISDIVYGVLVLPGPGAGVLIFGGILCFWLLVGLILVKKHGTAVAMSMLLIAFDLLFGNQAVIIQSLDVLFIVAIIIEVVCLIPVGHAPWNHILLPVFLAVLSLMTLALALLGQAKQGETDIPLTQFPIVYCFFGILGLCYAFICYRYPVKYLVAAGLANLYYMLHFWLFWGDGFASRFPPDLPLVPVLLLVALLGGVFFASAAYGIELLRDRYLAHKHKETGIA